MADLIIKVREAECENNELKDKLQMSENNVRSFIHEMGDMLDSHELSTNIVSDENMSLNNSHSHNQMNDYNNNINNNNN